MMEVQTLITELLIAANAADTRYITPPGDGEWFLDAAYFTPATAVAVSATDYGTLLLKQGSTEISTLLSTVETTGTGAWVAGVPIAVPLLTSEAAIAGRTFTGGTDALAVVGDGTAGDTGVAVDGSLATRWRKLRTS